MEIKYIVNEIQANMHELEANQRAAAVVQQDVQDRMKGAQKSLNEIHNTVQANQKTLYNTHSAAAATYGIVQDQIELQAQWIEYERFEKTSKYNELHVFHFSSLLVNLREKIFEWLCPEPYDKRHQDIRRQREKDTGQWLLDTPEYIKWSSGKADQRILWGHGIRMYII
jgi:hypothetical protein